KPIRTLFHGEQFQNLARILSLKSPAPALHPLRQMVIGDLHDFSAEFLVMKALRPLAMRYSIFSDLQKEGQPNYSQDSSMRSPHCCTPSSHTGARSSFTCSNAFCVPSRIAARPVKFCH